MSANEDSWGVQDDGSFSKKDVQQIQDSLIDIARSEFGQNVDLAPGSPHRQIIDLATIELADVWDSLEATYYSSYFADSFGAQLDKILALAGVGRLPRRGAEGEVTFRMASPRAEDTPIPRGTEVSTRETEDMPAIPFKTTEQARVPAGEMEVTRVPITAMEPWETSVDEGFLGEDTNVAAGTIQQIATPVRGVAEVTNPLPTGSSGTRDDSTQYTFTRGRNRETDTELKTRYTNSLSSGGTATLEAIRSNVYNADDSVVAAEIVENNTPQDNTGSGGLPPKSFRVTVLGGVDENIAQAILDSRSAGIQSYGSESAVAELDDGEEYTEYFERASETSVFVDVNLQVTDTFPSDGEQLVRDNIIRYIGGVSSTGTEFAGTVIGEDVMYDVVHAAAMNVQGAFSVDVSLGTSSSDLSTQDITISDSEIARTDADSVTVNFTIDEIP